MIVRFTIPAACALALLSGLALAHPHVYVDARVAFVIDAGDRATAVRITWVFDPFYSMLLLSELNLDPAADPGADGLAAIAALQPEWAQDFGGDGEAAIDGAPLALGPAHAVEAAMVDGQIALSFTRALETPIDPRAASVSIAVFDPFFFVAYTLVGAQVDGAGCAASVVLFDPDADLQALQGTLLELGVDEKPSDPGVGRLFADRAVLTCA